MAFLSWLILLQGLAYLASAATVRTPGSQVPGPDSLQLLLPNATDSTLIHPLAIPGANPSSVNTSVANSMVKCFSYHGHTVVNPASCRNALRKIPRSTYRYTFGSREFGRNYDFTLPYIFVSDDATCAVYVASKPGVRPDVYRWKEVSESAERVQEECSRHFGKAGAAYGLGEGGRLSVSIFPLRNQIECEDGPAPSYAPCRNVLDTMPWDQVDHIFGPNGQYGLPYSLRSADGQCEFQITSNGAASMTSWARIFDVIAAVDEVCVKNGKSGHGYMIGSYPYLNISIATGHAATIS